MTKIIHGIYERGVIRPLKKLPFSNRQKIELRIEVPDSVTEATKAIIRIPRRFGKTVAESSQLSILES